MPKTLLNSREVDLKALHFSLELIELCFDQSIDRLSLFSSEYYELKESNDVSSMKIWIDSNGNETFTYHVRYAAQPIHGMTDLTPNMNKYHLPHPSIDKELMYLTIKSSSSSSSATNVYDVDPTTTWSV